LHRWCGPAGVVSGHIASYLIAVGNQVTTVPYRDHLQAVGRGAAPLLLWVAVHDQTLKEWTALPVNNQVGKVDPAKELGRLLFALDVLATHYGVVGDQAFGAGETEMRWTWSNWRFRVRDGEGRGR
jgi:hypothetical protein